MRVKTNSKFTFFYEMVPYDVEAGQVIDGTGARHLFATGADVTVLDEESAAEPVVELPVEVVDELDISAKIDDVLAWVGDDPERALEAHAAEEAKGDKARTRLLARLEEIATGDQEPAEDGPAGSDD